VMERHEGRIEIDSELSKGTTIRLRLPLPKSGEAELTAEGVPVLPPPMRILCIDDEPLVRELMQELLESDGHTVQVADNGQTGIEEFRTAVERSRPFDVVITDLGMPFVDGRQVARTLKSEFPKLPVILLTGWGSFMKADGDLPPGVDAVLSKPPRLKELRQMLLQVQPIERAADVSTHDI